MDQQDPPAAAGARLYSDPKTEIVLHLGLHCTDEEKLIWSLRRDKAMLEGRNIAVPRRRFFTSILREFTTQRLKGARAGLAEQEELFQRLIGTAQIDRLVLSYDSFLGAPDRICAEGTLYPKAGRKALDLRNLFPDNRIAFLCAVKNPVTFLADLYRRVGDAGSFDDFVGQVDLSRFRWSNVIARIREATPDVPITVWANEDTPFVWGEVLRTAAGLAPDRELTGRFDVARSIMTEEGRAAFDAYVAEALAGRLACGARRRDLPRPFRPARRGRGNADTTGAVGRGGRHADRPLRRGSRAHRVDARRDVSRALSRDFGKSGAVTAFPPVDMR